MRILLAALILLPGLASAKCASSYLSVWPAPGATVPTNPQIVVEGFGGDQAVVKAIAEHGAFLVDPRKRRVPLKLVATNSGHMRLTQAVLQPTQALRPNTRYRLLLKRGSTWSTPSQYTADGKARAAWTTAAKADDDAPEWTGDVAVGEGSYQAFGCGPAINVEMTAPVRDASPLLIEVTLARADATRTWLLPLEDDGRLRVGHGMCSGAFDVSGAEERSAKLVAVDAAGNRRPLPEAVLFAGVVAPHQ